MAEPASAPTPGPSAPAVPAKGLFDVVFPDFSKSRGPVLSDRARCLDFNWRVRVHPLGAREGLGRYLSVDLIFDEPPPPRVKAYGSQRLSEPPPPPPPQPAKCTADIRLSLVSADASVKARRVFNRGFTFSPQAEMRFDTFVSLEELRGGKGAFLEDDKLTIRVSIKAAIAADPSKPAKKPQPQQTVHLTIDTLVASPELWATADNLHRTRGARATGAVPLSGSSGVPLNRLAELVGSVPFTPHDFRIVVDGQSLGAHREVLARGSAYFRSGALERMREGQEGVLRLDDEGPHGQPATFAAAEAALRYMYTHVSPAVPAAELRPLLALACYWGVRGLPSLCVEAIRQTLTPATVVETFLWAHSQSGLEGPEDEEAVWRTLVNHCCAFVKENAEEVAGETGAETWAEIDEQLMPEMLAKTITFTRPDALAYSGAAPSRIYAILGQLTVAPGSETLLRTWALARRRIGAEVPVGSLLPSFGPLLDLPAAPEQPQPQPSPQRSPQQQPGAPAAAAPAGEPLLEIPIGLRLQLACLAAVRDELGAVAAASEREFAARPRPPRLPKPEDSPTVRMLQFLEPHIFAGVLQAAAAAKRPAASSAAAARAWIQAHPGYAPEAAEQVLSSVPWAQISLAEYPVHLQDPVLKGYACLDRLLAEAQYERMVPGTGKRPPPQGLLEESARVWKRFRTGE
eukprot:tig00020563_g11273.t1